MTAVEVSTSSDAVETVVETDPGTGGCGVMQRRSALTSAFAEAALHDANDRDHEACYSALSDGGDRCSGYTCSASITVGSPTGRRQGPSFGIPHIRIMEADDEHHPYGGAGASYCSSFQSTPDMNDECDGGRECGLGRRQHGSFSCLSLLAEECSSPYGLGSPSRYSYPGNSSGLAAACMGERDGNGVEESWRGGRTRSSVEDGGSVSRLVVVHPSHEDEESCKLSAGKKQRGSNTSLLLLEAQRLSTLDASDSEMEHGDYLEMPHGFPVTACTC